MGSEKKSKRRRSSSSDSDSEEGEKRSKKHRTTREEKERSSSSKRDKKEKTKDKKKSHKHHSKHSDRGKKSEEKHGHKRHKRNSHLDFPELSSDDYFAKNNEFATWLKEEKKIFFSDLSSEDARKLFTGFIKDWNKGKLESQYYQGITSGPRTAHNWKIKGK